MTPPASPFASRMGMDVRMHIDSLAGSPRTPHITTTPRRVEPVHQYFAAQHRDHEVPRSRLQHLYAAQQAQQAAQAGEEYKDADLTLALVPHVDSCTQPNGDPLDITMKDTLTLRVKACGKEHTLKLTSVYYAKNVVHNLLSYGVLDRMGYSLAHRAGRRVLAAKDGGCVVFDVDLRRNVLVVEGSVVKLQEAPAGVIMAALQEEAHGDNELSPDIQQGTLLDFHKRLGHIHYDAVERLARDPSSEIALTDHKRVNCLTCAEGKQSKGRQSKKDSGTSSPIDRIGGVICSDLKGPMTPRDRLGNRYMINFVDHKSNYVRVFLAKTKDQAAKKFEHFLVFFEKEFNCKIRVLRTDSGGEYENVDLFCKTTGVARQRSKAKKPTTRRVTGKRNGCIAA
ncbi:hypothetical protein PHMEG_00011205 [Phytophthora megakarya]|uniref:Integrase catalytic domain-containing protein n=1 Tax=Phytophthora megakarya TaxID=4795 RepID=A0A225WDU6_9STRA|nr:hypothetical protein PHMEG_00011205 [Phytophthora megakarya]